MGNEFEQFIEAVGEHAGYHDPLRLKRAVQATLQALGSHLGGVPSVLHESIPACLHYWLYTGSQQPPLGPAAVYLAISNENRLRVTTALEIVLGVVRELWQSLDPHAAQLLRERLPPAWMALAVDPTSDAVCLGPTQQEHGRTRPDRLQPARSRRSQRALVTIEEASSSSHLGSGLVTGATVVETNPVWLGSSA